MNELPQDLGHDPSQHPTPPPPPPSVAAPTASLKDVLRATLTYLQGPSGRAERRPTPRFSVLVAVAGALLIVAGLVGASIVAEVPAALMILVFLALTAGGYALVWLFRDGPLATAGATASAFSLPLLLVVALGGHGDLETSVGVAILLSFIGWIAAYLVGPGRGHVVYATLPLIGIAIILAGILSGGEDAESGVGIVWGSVIAGGIYVAAGYLLDRFELSGVATAFVGTGNALILMSSMFIVTSTGIAAFDDIFASATTSSLSGDFSSTPSISLAQLILPGIVLGLAGVGMIRYGVEALRRATAWIGCSAVVTGGFSVLLGLFGTNGTLLALSVVALGATLVVGAFLISSRIGEADELAEAPSFRDVGLIQAIKESLPVKVDDPAVFRSFGGAAWFAAPRPSVQGAEATAAVAAATDPGAGHPPRPGWWLASDGAWYPPVAPPAPPAAEQRPTAAVADLPPAPGWWKASDGHWYPPQSR